VPCCTVTKLKKINNNPKTIIKIKNGIVFNI
jgi:hypothetical protein